MSYVKNYIISSRDIYTEAAIFTTFTWKVVFFVNSLDAWTFSMFHKGWFTWLMFHRGCWTLGIFDVQSLVAPCWDMGQITIGPMKDVNTPRILEKLFHIIQLSKMHPKKASEKLPKRQTTNQPTTNNSSSQQILFWWKMKISMLFQHRHEALSCTYVQGYRVKLQPFILGKWFLVTQKNRGPTVDGSKIRRSPVDIRYKRRVFSTIQTPVGSLGRSEPSETGCASWVSLYNPFASIRNGPNFTRISSNFLSGGNDTLLVQHWWSKNAGISLFFRALGWVGSIKTPQFYQVYLGTSDDWIGSSDHPRKDQGVGHPFPNGDVFCSVGIFGRSEFVPKEMVGEQKRKLFFVGI